MRNKGKLCVVKSCGKKAFCKGYCTKHYQQMRFFGKVKEISTVFIQGICKNIGCGKKLFAKGYCQTHYLEQKEILNATE